MDSELSIIYRSLHDFVCNIYINIIIVLLCSISIVIQASARQKATLTKNNCSLHFNNEIWIENIVKEIPLIVVFISLCIPVIM